MITLHWWGLLCAWIGGIGLGFALGMWAAFRLRHVIME